jgi:hypothetical protein
VLLDQNCTKKMVKNLKTRVFAQASINRARV